MRIQARRAKNLISRYMTRFMKATLEIVNVRKTRPNQYHRLKRRKRNNSPRNSIQSLRKFIKDRLSCPLFK